MSEEYIKPGRVLIAAQIVLVPIYFFLLANLLSVDIPLIPHSLSLLLVRIISPITLALPIVLFSFFQRYEISDAYENMGETVWNLPASIKAFYGFNFVVIIFFGLPIIAPLISLTGGYFIGLVLFKKKEDVVQISRPLIRFSTMIYLPFGIFICILFYYQITPFFTQLAQLWVNNINFLYLSSLNLANGALISGLILALSNYFEKNSLTFEKPEFLSAIIGTIVFIVLELVLIYFYIYLGGITGTNQLIFTAVNVIGFLLSIILIGLKWLMRSEFEQESTGLVGWITIFAFQLINLISQGTFQFISQTTAIFLTSLIFIILFVSSYAKATKYS